MMNLQIVLKMVNPDAFNLKTPPRTISTKDEFHGPGYTTAPQEAIQRGKTNMNGSLCSTQGAFYRGRPPEAGETFHGGRPPEAGEVFHGGRPPEAGSPTSTRTRPTYGYDATETNLEEKPQMKHTLS